MPKNIFFESSIYHLLIRTKALITSNDSNENIQLWYEFLDSLEFEGKAKKSIIVKWDFKGKTGNLELDFHDVKYYQRGKNINVSLIRDHNNNIFISNAQKLKNVFKRYMNR